MSKIHTFTFTDDSKMRLDAYLTTELKTSRTLISKLISDGHCTVNDIVRKPAYKLETNDRIIVTLPEVKTFALSADNIPLNVVYEDDELIVLNKDFGMVVHPGHGHDTGTLVNALLNHCKTLSIGFHEHRPGIVHRLDKDTGGLIVVAKTQLALNHLADQFREKTAGRVYTAIGYGRPRTLSGTIENHLGRDPKSRKKFASVRNSKTGKYAKTHFKCLYSGPVSVFDLKLDTGRTHQIRVHLSESGCPIVNDPIYSTVRRLNSVTDSGLKSIIKQNKEMFLFARKLSFTHPVTLKKMHFTAELPKAFTDLLNYLDVSISE